MGFMERNKPVSEKDARGIILQILFILRASEARGHRLHSQDLKPSRFMLSGGEVRLSNISVAALDRNPARGADRTPSSQVLGEHDSQEAEDVPMSEEGDAAIVWKVGHILHEMLFTWPPKRQTLRTVQLPEVPKLSPECRDYLQRLLDRDRRPTLHDAWFDPFMYRGKQR